MQIAATQVKHTRWSVFATVVPSFQQPCHWTATNISGGGIFVTGTPIVKAGKLLQLEIVLPGAFGPSLEIPCVAQVVWFRLPGEVAPGRPAGMGMRFAKMSRYHSSELGAYIRELSEYHRTTKPRGSTPAGTEIDFQNGDGEIGLPNFELETLPPAPSATSKTTDHESPPLSAFAVGGTLPGPRSATAVIGRDSTVGSYRILKKIGEGGMGQVFLAEHRHLGRQVAIKLLGPQFHHDPHAVRRFFDEGRLVNRVQSDHIVQVTDFGVEQKQYYFVMEFLRGRTLTDVGEKEAPLDTNRVVHIATQLCDALSAVHRAGIIHRDLKPANIILVDRDGTKDYVKLLDFGVAKLRQAQSGDAAKTVAGVVLGTPGFMSPEQLLGNPVDHRCDIYALGVLIYLMLTRSLPFDAKTWPELMLKQTTQPPVPPSRRLRSDVPKILESVVLDCLQPEPTARPSSMDVIKQRLSGPTR
ncbi:MAG: hypothetical protein A2289_03275 [Deltaproteobacteria bacterium RIFOXYA12_FULL_58_15]|nr:MAG: hypothetical protein A2289_03275 [Deltaproteobacteria bacterium RIFOXYA12_FULL_58_15]OGR14073.1 MAG: hypothetical protein A2341_19250 [Deltaproteobacteria bacterium RIFOXYB12_FULL_58_9]